MSAMDAIFFGCESWAMSKENLGIEHLGAVLHFQLALTNQSCLPAEY